MSLKQQDIHPSVTDPVEPDPKGSLVSPVPSEHFDFTLLFFMLPSYCSVKKQHLYNQRISFERNERKSNTNTNTTTAAIKVEIQNPFDNKECIRNHVRFNSSSRTLVIIALENAVVVEIQANMKKINKMKSNKSQTFRC